jgi:hypothetical protein
MCRDGHLNFWNVPLSLSHDPDLEDGLRTAICLLGEQRSDTGSLAANWFDSSRCPGGDVKVVHLQETDTPHGGLSAQKVDVQAVRSGYVAILQTTQVTPGQIYTVSAWMRGTPGMTVKLALTQLADPYTDWAHT